jgi:biopolymer transport protein ExbD
MRFRSRRARQQVAELNVTAFMNLMVVLVPFLLIMAVFSRITIHELNLPSAADATPDEQPPGLQLEVIMRADRLVLADRRRGPLHQIPNTGEGYDLDTLTERLRGLKASAPQVDSATILLEPQVDYQSLISVMDALRGGQPAAQPGMMLPELFPNISIGDAPAQGAPSR